MAEDRGTKADGSPNGKLLNDAIRHDVFLHRHATQNRNDVVAFLNDEMIPDLEDRILGRLSRIANAAERGESFRGAATIARLKDLRDALDDQVGQSMAKVTEQQTEAMSTLGVAESAWTAKALERAIPAPVLRLLPEIELATLPTSIVAKIVRTRPFQGKLLADQWADLGAGFQLEIERQVKLGMVAGETMDQLRARIFGRAREGLGESVVGKLRREATTIARTAVIDVANAVRHETFLENDDIVESEKIVATLDTRTCPYCGKLDGTEYRLDEAGPRPPFHFQCRCTLVPVMRLDRELRRAGLLDDLPPSTRAAVAGPVPDTLTYPEWLKDQDDRALDVILGPGRAAIFRRGEIPFAHFSGEQGRPLTLEALEKLEASLR